GYGGSTAAPIARKIFDTWLLGKMPESEQDPRDIGLPAPVVVGLPSGARSAPPLPAAPATSAR
ncbi:MAG TPA: hypothetical protein VEY92_12670, partial [Pseudoxanthomonas sp.]|nr:hypothetical protein [Pseudoxanthomonas sp.]